MTLFPERRPHGSGRPGAGAREFKRECFKLSLFRTISDQSALFAPKAHNFFERRMLYLAVYIAIGLLFWLIYKLRGKFFLVDPRKKFQTYIAQIAVCVILWPLIVTVVEFDRLIAIKQSLKRQQCKKLESSLLDLLEKPNLDQHRVSKVITSLDKLGWGYGKKEEESLTCTRFWVEYFRNTEIILRVNVKKTAIESALFGIDYLLRPDEDDGTNQKSDESSPLYRDTGRFSIMYRRAEPSGEPWLSIFTRDFKKSISKLDKKIKGRIVEAIMEICESPIEMKGDTQKPLVGELDGHWRYRIGDYRLIYLPMVDHHKIIFSNFDTRGQIYQ